MKLTAIKDSEFEREVLNAGGLVIANLWAPWSRPSRIALSILEQIGDRHAADLKIVTVNVDKNEKTAKDFGVNKIPTLLFFEGGKLVDRAHGISSLKYLEARINLLISAPASPAMIPQFQSP
ncbi:MAG: thioredoxin family protein [Ignavibacteria bacterium]|nr:MAG: thioredoxin family protein [Ignavibacteria bacterium]